MDNVEEMMVVLSVDLNKEVIVARGVVTFHYFRHVTQLLYDFVERLWVLQVQADESTGLLANLLRIDNKL